MKQQIETTNPGRSNAPRAKRSRKAAWLFALVLCLPQAAGAQHEYTFVEYLDGVAITGYSGPGGDLVIPSTLGGLSVIWIGAYSFQYQNSVTSVVIPDTATNIGDGAFYGCAGLTRATIPASLSNIGFRAFEECTALSEIEVDASNPAFSSIDGVLFNQAATTLLRYPAELFQQICPSRGVAYGFRYAFGANLPPEGPLLRILIPNGRRILETPAQDPATLTDAELRVVGATDLSGEGWTLPIQPAADTTGKPAGCEWHEPEDPPPARAFFKLEASLK